MNDKSPFISFCGGGMRTATKKRLPTRVVEDWLKTLYTSIIFPPSRGGHHPSAEHRPLSLRAFFEVISYLVVDVKVLPPHTLAWFLEGLLDQCVKGRDHIGSSDGEEVSPPCITEVVHFA